MEKWWTPQDKRLTSLCWVRWYNWRKEGLWYSNLDYKNHQDDEATRLRRRRRVTIIMITLLFLFAGVILTASVVHDVQSREVGQGSLEEPHCVNLTEGECQATRCPVTGWRWSEKEMMCEVIPGYKCCTACTGKFQCFPVSQTGDIKCCFANGIVPSAYKNTCHKGFVWVAWKRICVRKN